MWLVLIIVGIVLAVLGIFIQAAKFLIWLGIIVLVISIIMSLITRARRRA